MYKLLNLNVTLLNLNVRMLNSIRKRYILVTSGVSKKTLTKIQDYSRHFSQEQKSMGVAQLFFFQWTKISWTNYIVERHRMKHKHGVYEKQTHWANESLTGF